MHDQPLVRVVDDDAHPAKQRHSVAKGEGVLLAEAIDGDALDVL